MRIMFTVEERSHNEVNFSFVYCNHCEFTVIRRRPVLAGYSVNVNEKRKYASVRTN
jgi:hypothetical protein